MRVLLTGIGGSIGCHMLISLLENTDWEIVGIDSFRHKGWTDRIEEVLEDMPECIPRVSIYTHDLVAPLSEVLIKKIGGIDYIINMASLSDVEASIQNPAPFIMNNVAIATNMLDYARQLLDGFHRPFSSPHYDPGVKLKAFIQISTDEVYGPSGETDGHPEWSPILPSNPYAASKAAQEAIAISYWRSYGIPLIITNTMNNFGEMQQSSKFPAIVQRKVMNGETVTIHGNEKSIGSRYYIHSQNFADAIIYLLKNKAPYLHQDGEIDRPDRFNIVGDRRINNLELAQMIAKLLNKELKYELVDFHAARPGHDRHYGLTGDKLAALGWKPPREFEDSLSDTIEWTLDHPEWQ